MNIIAKRFEEQLMRDLTDNNYDDMAYYDYYSRVMKSINISCCLHFDKTPIDKNPNGKTVGEKIGIKPIYYIHVASGTNEAVTEKSEYISAVIFESFKLAQTLRSETR